MHTRTIPAPETRPYPYDCRSAYCARTQCDDRPACDCGNADAYWDGYIRREYACEDCHRASTTR